MVHCIGEADPYGRLGCKHPTVGTAGRVSVSVLGQSCCLRPLMSMAPRRICTDSRPPGRKHAPNRTSCGADRWAGPQRAPVRAPDVPTTENVRLLTVVRGGCANDRDMIE